LSAVTDKLGMNETDRTASDGMPVAERLATTKELDRTLSFSDGVFAIAITLLAFNIDSPQTADVARSGDLGKLLWEHLPDFVSFGLSFFVIGSYWIVHHSIFRHIRRFDTGLLWLNLALLFCIAFMPYPTVVLGNHSDQLPAVEFYAVCLAVTGIIQLVLWAYAAHHGRLIEERMDPLLVRFIFVRIGFTPAVFLLSIPIAFISLEVAKYMWGAVFVLNLLMARFYPHYRRLATR
jgi:uncharacterized membrane protein